MTIAWMAVSSGSTRIRSAAGATADAERSRAGPAAGLPAAFGTALGAGACDASYYATAYYTTAQRTATGETYDPNGPTTAHRTLPLGSKIRVTSRITGGSVVVRGTDRGPYVGGRCLDLSRAAMVALGGITAGVVPVGYQVLGPAGAL